MKLASGRSLQGMGCVLFLAAAGVLFFAWNTLMTMPFGADQVATFSGDAAREHVQRNFSAAGVLAGVGALTFVLGAFSLMVGTAMKGKEKAAAKVDDGEADSSIDEDGE
jgi:hypothetical protein